MERARHLVAVGAGDAHREEVAERGPGELAVRREDVGGLADRAADRRRDGLGVRARDVPDRVVRVV